MQNQLFEAALGIAKPWSTLTPPNPLHIQKSHSKPLYCGISLIRIEPIFMSEHRSRWMILERAINYLLVGGRCRNASPRIST